MLHNLFQECLKPAHTINLRLQSIHVSASQDLQLPSTLFFFGNIRMTREVWESGPAVLYQWRDN